MMVQVKFAAIKGIKPHEWAIRFIFGGAVCVIAGLMSKWYGPAFGGLFLAFPSIFPASACLVESHERQHKARVGIDGKRRARVVAGVDAAGAAIGCFGLAAYAAVCWLCLDCLPLAAVFALAVAAWFVVAIFFWWLRKTRLLRRRKPAGHATHVFTAS